MGKKVPDKNRTITVNIFHDGVFTVRPFEYAVSNIKQITDIQFEGMSYVQFRDVIRKLIHGPVASLYYCKVGTPLRIGIKPIQNDSDVDQFVNFAYKNKWQIKFGVQLQCLFWNAASTTVEQLYYSKMEELKIISTEAYQYLCDRNPNSWCRAFFRQESKCPNFENGICESFNRAILVQRTKPIITMLEDIRLYVMQRLVAMNRVARTWEHSITPSIRKRVEVLKEKQRDWMVIPSGFQVLEVRKGHEAYGVNIHLKECMCRMSQLSGIPCVHSVAAYNHMNRDPIEGVDHFYSQQKWFEAYQFSIQPVFGSTMWKKTSNHPLLPPIIRTMPGRPRNSRMKGQSKNNSQVSKVGRKMTCTNCQETGHNKSSCKKPPVPKPINRPSVPKPHEYGTYASARGRGRGSRSGRGGFGGRGEGTATIGDTGRSQRERGRGQRGRGRGQRGRGRGQMQRDGEQMTEDEIRKNLKHEYMEEMLLQEEQKIDAYQAQQDEFDQEALRCTTEEEEARFKRHDEVRLKEQLAEQEWESKMDYYHPSNWFQEEESFKVEPYNKKLTIIDANVQTQEAVAANISDRGEIGFRLGDFEAEIPSEEPIATVTPSADKGKQLAEPSEQPELQLRRSKRKAPSSSEEAPAKQRIIFHKNSGRSERIFNQKMKKSGFGKDGEGSTPEKAFSLI
ncbi:zinc finger, PMZ-type containing protein [Tanacetum coccineum]